MSNTTNDLPPFGEGRWAAYLQRKGILDDPKDQKWDLTWNPSLTSSRRILNKIVGHPAAGTITEREHDRIVKHGLYGMFVTTALTIVSVNRIPAVTTYIISSFANRPFTALAAGMLAGAAAPYLGMLAGTRIGVRRVRRQRQANNG